MLGNQANCRSSGSLVPATAPLRTRGVTDIVHAVPFCAANWPESYSWVNTLVKGHHDPGGLRRLGVLCDSGFRARRWLPGRTASRPAAAGLPVTGILGAAEILWVEVFSRRWGGLRESVRIPPYRCGQQDGAHEGDVQ